MPITLHSLARQLEEEGYKVSFQGDLCLHVLYDYYVRFDRVTGEYLWYRSNVGMRKWRRVATFEQLLEVFV